MDAPVGRKTSPETTRLVLRIAALSDVLIGVVFLVLHLGPMPNPAFALVAGLMIASGLLLFVILPMLVPGGRPEDGLPPPQDEF